MRKQFLGQERDNTTAEVEMWLDLEEKAEVELSSEDPDFPFEEALAEGGKGWKASQAGKQVIRLLFEKPQLIQSIFLVFEEKNQERTQEFLLSWSPDKKSFKEIVRQQYNFNPPHTCEQKENYTVNLNEVLAIELVINPDINHNIFPATLKLFKIA